MEKKTLTIEVRQSVKKDYELPLFRKDVSEGYVDVLAVLNEKTCHKVLIIEKGATYIQAHLNPSGLFNIEGMIEKWQPATEEEFWEHYQKALATLNILAPQLVDKDSPVTPY